MDEYALLAVLLALLGGLVVGKAWERYKLRDGRWIDRRRLRETPHYMLGLNFLVDNQTDQALSFGESAATNEMCIFVGGYYPANDGEAITCLF